MHRSIMRYTKAVGTKSLRQVAVAGRFPRWMVIAEQLEDASVKSVDVTEAQRMLRSGEWAMIDVRPSNKEFSIMDAVHIPIFDVIDFDDIRNQKLETKLRAYLYAMSGVTPVELNEDFVDQVSQASGDKNVLLVCNTGGSLPDTPSRSLKAAWLLLNSFNDDNDKQIALLKGGADAWALDDDTESIDWEL